MVGLVFAFSLFFNGIATTHAASIQVGSQVRVVNASVAVRATPSTSGLLLGTRPIGSTGTVLGGPTVANGYTWWEIDWSNSTLQGWSVQTYLAVLSSPTSTPTSTTSFDFSLSNNGAATVTQGGSVVRSITTTLSAGTTQLVSFAASGLPSGVSASFSPTSCNPTCTTSLTLQATASAPLGSYPVTVTGTAGTSTRTTSFTLTVSSGGTATSTSFNFSLSGISNISLGQGSSTSQAVSALLSSGTAQSVSFSSTGLPSNASITFSPTSCSPTCSTLMSVQVGGSTPVGSYPVTITGTAGATSRTSSFTLTVTGSGTPTSTSPTLAMLAPLGGERWPLGSLQTIRWSSQGIPAGSVTGVFLVNASNPSLIVRDLATGIDNDGSETILVPIDVSLTSYRARVVIETPDGESYFANSGIFSVVSPSIAVTAPVSSQVWSLATTQAVTWTSTDVATGSLVTINLLRSSGLSLEATLADDIPNTGSAQVFVPVMATGTFRVQVVATDPASGLVTAGLSPSMSVRAPTGRIITPTTGSRWYFKNTQPVTWSATGTPADAVVSLELILSDTAQTVVNSLAQNLPNNGAADITVPVPSIAASLYRVRLTMTYNDEVLLTALSNTFAVTQAPLTFITPVAGSQWYFGTRQMVRWSATNTSPEALVKIMLIDTDSAQTVIQELHENFFPNTGSAEVLVPAVPARNYRVKIIMTQDDEQILSAVTASFALSQAPLTFVTPNASTTWIIGREQTVQWFATGTLPEAFVRLALVNTDSAQSEVQVLATEEPNNGNATFTLPVVPLTQTTNAPRRYMVRLEMFYQDALIIRRTSPIFYVAAPTLPILAPAGGENWTRGTNQTVRWDQNAIPANSRLTIEILTGTTSQPIEVLAQDQPNDGSAQVLIPPYMDIGSARMRISATYEDQPLTTAQSNQFNVVPPVISVTQPASGTIWYLGSTGRIEWTNLHVPSSSDMRFAILLSGDDEEVAEFGRAGSNTGVFSGVVAPIATGTYQVQVTATHPDGQVTNALSAPIQILEPPVSVLAPQLNDFWVVGLQYNARWTTSTLPSSARISFDIVEADTYEQISQVASELPNTGSANVRVPAELESGTKRLKLMAYYDGQLISTAYSAPINLRLTSDLVSPTITPIHPTRQSYFYSTSSAISIAVLPNDNVGVTSVTWENTRTGAAGDAVLGYGWWGLNIPLTTGDNVIKFFARDFSGNTGVYQINVIYRTTLPHDYSLTVRPANISTSTTPLVIRRGSGTSYGTIGTAWVTAAMRTGILPATSTFFWEVLGVPTVGMQWGLASNICRPLCQNYFAVGAYANAVPGTYPITFKVSGAGLERSVIMQLRIQ